MMSEIKLLWLVTGAKVFDIRRMQDTRKLHVYEHTTYIHCLKHQQNALHFHSIMY
jgi:hypothetical protein